jgi:hypothetical protein
MREITPDLSAKKIIFWEDQGFLQYSIAYWLQKKLDCKMFAIIDTTDRTKSFFQNQKLVNFEKIWFFHDHILRNKTPDLKYLNSIEEKYDLSLWLIAANERIFYGYNNYHKFSEDEVLSILEQECRLYEKILDEIKPDFLITSTNLHQNHIFFKICEARKIKILFFTASRLGRRCMLSHDMDTVPLQATNLSIKKSNTFNDLQNRQKQFSLFDETKKYVDGFSNSKIDLLKSAVQFLLISNNSNVQTHYTYYGRTKFKVLINSIIDKITTNSRTKFVDNFFQKKITDSKFIFFPLQLDPERTTLIDAPFFTNQLELVRNTAKSLPIGYKLYVKEHSAMITRSWRSLDYYKELQKIPNVILIHPSIPPEEILKQCSLVITINSTAAFDGAFYEKPSIVFGDPMYSNLPFVHKVDNIKNLPHLIRKALEVKVDLDKLNDFVNLLEENSFEFEWMEFTANVHRSFFINGNLIDTVISDETMKQFQKTNEEILLPLIDEHIKKIYQYIQFENNID